MFNNRSHIYGKITNYLHVLGIPVQVMGFIYLREAIKLCVEDRSIRMGTINKKVYSQIAKKMGTSASKVERNIRFAIDSGWLDTTADKLNGLIGTKIFSPNTKPTNSMLIMALADKFYLDSLE